MGRNIVPKNLVNEHSQRSLHITPTIVVKNIVKERAQITLPNRAQYRSEELRQIPFTTIVTYYTNDRCDDHCERTLPTNITKFGNEHHHIWQ